MRKLRSREKGVSSAACGWDPHWCLHSGAFPTRAHPPPSATFPGNGFLLGARYRPHWLQHSLLCTPASPFLPGGRQHGGQKGTSGLGSSPGLATQQCIEHSLSGPSVKWGSGLSGFSDCTFKPENFFHGETEWPEFLFGFTYSFC